MDGGVNLPPGLTWRFGTPDDVDVITDLVASVEARYDGVVEIDRSDVVADFGRLDYDVTKDLVLVYDGETAVAWADVYKDRSERDVRPSHHRRGIGTALARWSEERARELGVERISQTVTDHNADARELLLANGYEATRWAWILEIRFDGPPPEQPTPPGISIRPYDDRDAHDAYELVEEAFGEWEGRRPMTFDEWAWLPRHEAFAPELSRLAFEGDELVGVVLAFDYTSADEGWVQQVATRASHRNRGIARALLYETFRAFHERGKARCGLSTDSRTGALALYERVGMHVRRSYTTYAKTL